MKSYLSFLSLLAVLNALAYTPLDTQHPVFFDGSRVTYDTISFVPGLKCVFVDGNLSDTEAAASPWVFNDFKEASKHFTDGTEMDPMLVYIAPWVYWLDDPDDPEVRVGENGREPFGMVIHCQNLHLIGLNPDPKNVVLAAARGQTQGAVGNFTMLDYWGDGLYVRDLTMGNFCNVDLDFPLNPSLSRPKRMSAITQAHVAYCHGDKARAENVRFISRLNMNPLNGAKRILYSRCHMEMTDDALTGNGVYLQCSLDYYGSKPFWATHPNGAVFLDCDINMPNSNDRVYFCKGVGPVTVVDSRIHAGRPLYMGWTAYPPLWLRCYQYGVTLDSLPYYIGADAPVNTVDLSSLPLLRAFRVDTPDGIVYNTYNLLAGDDGWDPLSVKDLVDADRMPTSLILTPNSSDIRTGDSPLELKAAAFYHAGYPAAVDDIRWSVPVGMEQYVRITPDGDRCIVEAIKETDGVDQCLVTATTPSGLTAAVALNVHPSVLDAPEFLSQPNLYINKGVASVDYSLQLDGRDDHSIINWYRCTSSNGDNPVQVAVSRLNRPLLSYPLTQDDCGYYIMAEIAPKSPRSAAGDPVRLVSKSKVSKSQVQKTSVISTDFENFPTSIQPQVMPGFWTVDCYKPIDTAEYDWLPDPARQSWIYDFGFNGAVGSGLLQDQKGARLMYTPVGDTYADMSVRLDVDPTKTAGQGFGSATGQYMDVCIKFDTSTLTGYALRIERTTKYSNAVDFSLVRYEDGIVTPLTDPVSSVCYRTGCHISIDAVGDTLTADVVTDTPVIAKDPALTTSVHLSAPISASPHGGFAIQHTGSCGESTTMLHHLSIKYH